MTPDDYDRERLGALRRARRRATALLGAVAVVFVATFFMGDAVWVGFLRTTMEASMIGGLADWFAVTALFRHPLGLPIPHTAIIPRSKDGLAASLGEFVRHNFLSPELLVERLSAARVPERIGGWLTRGGNAHTVAGHLVTTTALLTEELDRPGGGDELLASLPVARWAGRGLQSAVAGRHHTELVSRSIAGLASILDEQRDVLHRHLRRESPWWVPASVDEAVFDRAHQTLRRFLLEVADDPDHEMRRALDVRLLEVAVRLQEDPAWQATLNRRLAELLEGSDFAAQLSEAARAGSQLRDRAADALRRLGKRLRDDPELVGRVEEWLQTLAGPVAEVGRRELGDLIAITVQRWDADDASRRLELWMGRDLQFVRINGTVVGGLAGLTIHTLVFVLAG